MGSELPSHYARILQSSQASVGVQPAQAHQERDQDLHNILDDNLANPNTQFNTIIGISISILDINSTGALLQRVRNLLVLFG